MESAQFSVSALEKHCNLSTKVLVQEHLNADSPGKAARIADFNAVIGRLEYLLLISPTAERYSLLGSAYKRKAIITGGTQRKAALKAAAFYYYMAAQKTRFSSVYAVTNWFELETIVRLNDKKDWGGQESVTVSKNMFVPQSDNGLAKSYALPARKEAIGILTGLEAANGESTGNMDYWQMAATANLTLCRLVLNARTGSADWGKLIKQYQLLWKKTGSVAKRKTELEHVQALQETLIHKSGLKDNLKKLEQQLNGR